MPRSKLANLASPPHLNPSLLFPTWKCISCQDEGLSYLFTTDCPTQPGTLSQVFNDSPWERRNSKAERKEICMTKRETLPAEESMKLIDTLMRTLERCPTEVRTGRESASW